VIEEEGDGEEGEAQASEGDSQ
jgi:hypothetical protein